MIFVGTGCNRRIGRDQPAGFVAPATAMAAALRAVPGARCRSRPVQAFASPGSFIDDSLPLL